MKELKFREVKQLAGIWSPCDRPSKHSGSVTLCWSAFLLFSEACWRIFLYIFMSFNSTKKLPTKVFLKQVSKEKGKWNRNSVFVFRLSHVFTWTQRECGWRELCLFFTFQTFWGPKSTLTLWVAIKAPCSSFLYSLFPFKSSQTDGASSITVAEGGPLSSMAI